MKRAIIASFVLLECYSLADVNTHCCDLIRTNLTLSGNLDARYRRLCVTP
jgi:hypothetical protein